MKTQNSTMTAVLRWNVALLLAAVAWSLSGCGGSGSGSPTPSVTPPVVSTQGIRLLSGDLSGSGNVDGVGTQARFNAPQGLASDATGNVYVADTGNATIRKISSTGEVSTLAGSAGFTGQEDGQAAAARFMAPAGIVSAADGTLWVTDGNRVRKITPSGTVSTLIDTGVGLNGLARDANGQLYAIADNSRVLKITTQGGVSTATDMGVVFPGGGFRSFLGIAVDALGNVYVASQSTSSVRKITPAGVISTFAGLSYSLGASTTIGATVAQMSSPSGIAIDAQGNVVVTDASDYVRTINPAGILVSVLQFPPKGGGTTSSGITVDSSGRTMVTWKDAVYTPGVNQVLNAYAGLNSSEGASYRPWIAALGTNSAGGIYFLERVGLLSGQLRSASADGVVTTIGARNLRADDWGTVNPSGDVYAGHTVIEQGYFVFNEKGGVVSKLAYSGTQSGVWSSDSQVPEQLQLDGAGNLHLQYRPGSTYGATWRPPQQYTIAKIDGGNNVVDAVAVPYQGAGPSRPKISFAIDPAGGYFVGDSHAVFKVSAAGQLTLLAGSVDAPGAVDGTGSTARFNGIASLAVDSAGNVLVADKQNHAIRKITPSGVVTTVVGQLGKVGGSVGALPGTLLLPEAILLDARGVLYVAAAGALLRVQFP